MRNRGFKKLADENKKTERNAKLYFVGIAINVAIIVFMFVSIILILVFKPDIFYKRKNNNEYNNSDIIKEYTPVYTDFNISVKAGKYTVLGNKNGEWKEIANTYEKIDLMGEYDGCLFFVCDSGMKYINLKEDEYKFEEWLTYKQYIVPDTNETGTLKVSNAYLVDGYIYFKYDLDIASTVSSGGILKISTRANSFDEAEQIIPDVKVDEWTTDKRNKVIYYLNSSNEIHKYEINNKNDSVVINEVKSFQFSDNKILYLKVNNEYRETSNSIVQAVTYELCLYNLSNNSLVTICNSPVYNVPNRKLKILCKIL